jgi:4-hydroxy 2-oxovalerate aldolase
VVGFLMMAHMIPTAHLLQQAKLMESYGAHCVYITDSAGALLMDETRERVTAFKNEIGCQIGFHNHNNLGLGVANTIIAIECGADRADASLAGMGAGAGNCALEVLIAVTDRMGINTGVELYPLIDGADQLVRPIQKRPVQTDGNALMLGFAGVYSSFLLHTERAAKRFNVDPRDILVELGRRKMIGGQEDMIVDVALDLVQSNRD